MYGACEQFPAATPDDPALQHSLGLLLVRTDRQDEGLAALQRAANLAPDIARFAYVYAVALNSLGRSDDAVEFLYEVRDRFPGDFDLNWALATMLRDQGRTEESRAVATALADGYPGVLPVRNLLDAL